MLIISGVCGLQCTNSVLLGNLEESGGKWILDFYWALRIFNCADFPSYPCQYTCFLWFWTLGFRYFPLSFLLIRCLHIMVGDMGISAFILFSLSVLVMRPMRDIEYQHSQKMCIRDGCRTSIDLAAIPCPAGFQSTGVKTVVTFISASLRFDDSGHYTDPGLHGSFFRWRDAVLKKRQYHSQCLPVAFLIYRGSHFYFKAYLCRVDMLELLANVNVRQRGIRAR